jgi:archaemetzincin
MAPPKPGEWLSQHGEPGQTFEQYLKSHPVLPTANRRKIYIQPLGDFGSKQREVISLTAEYIGIYFNLPVKTLGDMPLSTIPDEARRVHPDWGDRQVLTTHVLDKVLSPRLPKDAFGFISFTSSDLWPGAGWNFVFGQASLRDRVGVWSLYRFGDPAASGEAFRLCLRRTAALGTHELGHMFSILHCTAYECNMCGSNSLPESDRRPIADCPECMAKICWAAEGDPGDRYEKLGCPAAITV